MEGDPKPRRHECSGSAPEPACSVGMRDEGNGAAGGLGCGGGQLDFANQRGEQVAAGGRTPG